MQRQRQTDRRGWQRMQCSAAAQQVAQREACGGVRVRRSGAMVCVCCVDGVLQSRSAVQCSSVLWMGALDVGPGRSRSRRPGH